MSRRERILRELQQSNRKFWEVRAATNPQGGRAGEVFIYGYITGYKLLDNDVEPKEFKDEIDALGDIETLYVRINSPGGNVFAGNAIYNILKRIDAEVIVTIDGLAASAASVIAMAGDRVVIAKNGVLMIHDPWALAVGNSKELRKVADTLDTIHKGLVAVYQEKTGLPKDEIIAMMEQETWMDAETAKKKGFVDMIDETKDVAASLRGDKLIVNGVEIDASVFSVLPPLKGLQKEPAAERPTRPSMTLRNAFNVIAKALGFGQDERGVDAGEQTDQPSNEVEPGDNEQAEHDSVQDQQKGSGGTMEVKNTQVVTEPTAHAAPASNADAKNVDVGLLMARVAELEARAREAEERAKAAEEMARAERDRRIEAEFIKRVEAYGTLPMASAELGPIMKRASEKLAKEDFEKLEALLKACGQALEQSEIFKSYGYAGEGDNSPIGQYRAELKRVREAEPNLSEVDAKLKAFSNLSPDVQRKLYDMGVEL